MMWKPLDQHLIAKAIFPLSKNIPHLLPLKLGDTVVITSKCEEWYRGYSLLKSSAESTMGIFPANYVKIVGKDPGYYSERASGGDYSTEEIKSTMMTTLAIHTSLILSYLSSLEETNDTQKFLECEKYFNKLIELFYEIANWSVNKDELIKLENQFIYITKIYRILNADVVIRQRPFTQTSVVNLSIMNVHKLYLDSEYSTDQILKPTDIRPDMSPFGFNQCLQIVVENFEFFGLSDDFYLQWMIIDSFNDTHHETFLQAIKECKRGRQPWMGEKFIYTEIADEIAKENAYLLIYVYRVGQLLTDLNKQVTSRFRRPLAIGSCCLKDLTSSSEKTTIALHSVSEADFLKSPREIMKLKFAPVTSRLLQISSTIVDQTKTDITEESHILRSLSLKTDNKYEYDRNSLYIKLDCAEFEKANKASQRNIEAQLFIVNEAGEKMPCFSSNPESSNKTEYFSFISYHNNSPKWKEIIKINLAELEMDECHVLINFYHCSTKDKKTDERKYFACCFLRLSEFLEAGVSRKSYTLSTQKLPESVKPNPKNYLPKFTVTQTDTDKTSSKEFCKIEIFLCSTFVSKNKAINYFLNMRFREDLPVSFLRDCLMEIQSIKNEDFLKPKLRQNIMSALRNLIIDKVYSFNTRVETDLFITWQAMSYKYIQFELEEELISFLQGSYCFLSCFLKGIEHLLSTFKNTDIPINQIKIVLESLGPLFEVLSSMINTDNQYETSLHLKEIFKWFLYIFEINSPSDNTCDIRAFILKFIINYLKHFDQILSIDVTIEYFNCLFETNNFKNGKIIPKEKLDFLFGMLNSDLYIQYYDIQIIFFLPTVEICLTQIEISSNCLSSAIEVMLHLFKQCKLLSKEDRIELVSQSLMKTLFTQSFNAFSKKYYSDLEKSKLSLYMEDQEKLKTMHHKHFSYNNTVETKFSMECHKLCILLIAYLEEWLEIKNECITLKEFYIVLENIRLILERNIYPKQWLSMYLQLCKVCGAILKKISSCFDNSNREAYDMLVLSYFDTCFSLIIHRSLQLQNFPFCKTQEIIEKYGDMRIDVMDCFLNVWKNKPAYFNSFDKDFMVQVTRKVLNISFIPEPGIRYKTIPLLVHTITNWIDKCGDIKEVLNDLISETELILRGGHCDKSYHETLIQILNLKRMSGDVEEVIESFTMLINLHLEYRKIFSGSYNVLHSQFLLHSFMKFYQDKVGIFTHFQHYSNKFSQMMETEEHYFEAALVLKRQYDCIHWESEEIIFDDIFYKNYDGIGNEQLKEQLAKRIIELLTLSKEYEYAAELCQELQSHYLNEYKYKDLNPLLNQLSRYYELIMTEQRLMLNYYRVTFIGGTLPSYMRQNRDYIVKGSIWFKTSTITSMLKSAFPKSIIKVYQSSAPTECQTDKMMTIYLAKMEPIQSDHDLIKNTKISFKIRSFYKDHKINCFFSDHPYHKGPIDKNNEVKSLHVLRVIVTTEMMMPNEFMWNPIIHEEREIFTPIDVAIETVEKKNEVIMEMIQELEDNQSKDLRPFTMLLTGTLDAGVNGGMPKYIEAFFSEATDGERQVDVDLLNCFRNVLIEQKNVLTEALVLHRKLAPPQILPMHERLEECFTYLKKSIIDLDVTRKRSFSNMRNLDDVYAHIHSLIEKGSNEMESLIEKVNIRDTFKSSDSSLKNLSEERHRSSNQSNSQSDTELDKCGLTPASPRRRLLSSTGDQMIQEMAKEYVSKQQNLFLTSAVSTPDMRPLTQCLSIDETSQKPMKSPPLPPREITLLEPSEDAQTFGQPKSLKSYIRTLVYRGNNTLKASNGKYSIEPRQKPKISLADVFKNVEQ